MPRVNLAPAWSRTLGGDACFLSSAYGLVPDGWQELVVNNWLGRLPDGRMAAPRCGLAVPRQNGKNGVLEVVELFKMVDQGRRVLHTAHEVKTARKAFLRLLSFYENEREFPELSAMVKEVRKTNGQEAIVLRNGGSVEFIARSRGSGRGFSVDDLVMDEAQELTEEALAALLPTISASDNPQQIMTGTPPGPTSQGDVFTRLRQSGVRGDDPRLCWMEWSCVDDSVDLDDREVWAAANPALGIRLRFETVADERAAMSPDTFARERLGVWSDDRTGGVIPSDVWTACLDRQSSFAGRPALAADVSLDRAWASIAAAGRREDGRVHVEVIQNEKGTSWVAGRLAEVAKKAGPCAVVVDPSGPAGSLLPELKELGVEVTTTGAREFGQACGGFYDDAVNDKLRHLGFTKLNVAVDSARKRSLGTAWAWDFRGSGVDGTPLTSVTLARHGLAMFGAERPKSKAAFGF